MSRTQKVVFDIDDFGVDKLKSFDLLKKIKEHYPNFKVSLFTVPLPEVVTRGQIKQDKWEKWGSAVNDYDWIEILPHGVSHIFGEGIAPMNKKEAHDYIELSEELFRRVGVKFEKIWKSPHWQTNELVYQELERRGYTVAVDRNNPPIGTFDTYIYNWAIDEQTLPDEDVIKAHGHMDTTSNALHLAYKNFTNLIEPDAEFMFISEYLNKNEEA